MQFTKKKSTILKLGQSETKLYKQAHLDSQSLKEDNDKIINYIWVNLQKIDWLIQYET